MKLHGKLLTTLFTILFASVVGLNSASAASGGVLVTNVSAKVLPASSMNNAAAWATNVAYTQGQYVLANGQVFMCLVAGTSTNVASGPVGQGMVTDGTATWLSALSRPRKGFVLINTASSTSANAYIMDTSAVTNRGILLGPNGCAFSISGADCSQSEYHAIYVPGESGIITMFEW